jgi:hypothetical protein
MLIAVMLTSMRMSIQAELDVFFAPVRFGLRRSAIKHAESADQILFTLFLPGAELMLAA